MNTANTDRLVHAERGFLVMCLFLALAAGCVFAQPTLPNGLQLVRFDVRAPEPAVAGGAVNVQITLKNDSGQRMQFDPSTGIFVGARVNSTSDANNRDFGHANKGLLLAPGAQVTLRASRPLDAAGEWRFWPSFRLNGQWGPFRWMEKTVPVYATAAEARSQGGTGPVVDMRNAIGRQFSFGLRQGKIFASGAEVQFQFPTRKYSQTPRRNTVVGTGRGTAAVRVEQAERRRQVGGQGSTSAGAGSTFLILKLPVRGNAAEGLTGRRLY